MIKIIQIPLILLFAIIQSCSPPFKQELKSISPALGFTKQIDSIVSHKMNQYNIPGLSIGLVKNDVIVYSKGYGIRSIVTHNQVTENTIFHTASISKLFTAVAIMQLVEQKVIALNDKLIDVLPDLNYTDKRLEQITIKNLLNHTSGLPDIRNYHWDNNNQSDNTLTNYIRGLDLKLESDPGSEFLYSNLSYNVLGYIIEKKTGSTFDDYLKKTILYKSGMNASDFRYFKITDSLKTAPHSRSWITKNTYERKIYPYTREHTASSTLNSSAIDMSKWMIRFLKTLSNEPENTYKQMIEPAFPSIPHIGLGFQLASIDSKKTIGHYGGDKGFRSYLLMIPEENIGLVVLANCDYEEDFRQEILHPIAKLMLTKNK